MEKCAPISDEKAWRNSCPLDCGVVQHPRSIIVMCCQQLAAKNGAYGILQGFPTIFSLTCESVGHFRSSVGYFKQLIPTNLKVGKALCLSFYPTGFIGLQHSVCG